MRDLLAIQNLIGHELNPYSNSSKYAKYEWINNCNDKNGGVAYDDGVINFDTKGYTDNKWIDYHNSYLTVPINIFGGTAEFLTSDLSTKAIVALKDSVTSLIYRCQISLNGVVVQNASNVNLYSHIKKMVNDDINYALSQGSLYHESKDTTATNDAAEFAVLAVAGDIPAKNPKFNKGFADRISFMKGYIKNTNVNAPPQVAGPPATGGGPGATVPNPIITSYYQFRAIIPLKFISNFFDELDFPLLNIQLNLNLGISGTSAAQGVIPYIVDAATYAASNVISMSIANQDAIKHPGIDNICKLWLAKVTFSPEVLVMLAQLMAAGNLTKTVNFYSVRAAPNLALTTGGSMEFQISSGIIMPRKLWTVIQPKGSAKSVQHPSPNVTDPTATITNANIIIDGNKFYQDDIRFDHEFYRMFKDQTFGGGTDTQSGSLVPFSDFVTSANQTTGIHRYYIMDFSSLTQNAAEPLKMFTLQFTGLLVGTGSYDVIHLIEHEVSVSINMKDDIVKVVGSF